MIDKIRGILKKAAYGLRYRGRVRFSGIPSMRHGASIKCRGGRLTAGHGFDMNSRAYCAVVNGGELRIGDGVSVNRNTMVICHEQITVGDGCSIGPNVLIYDHDHRFDENGIANGFHTAPVTIDDHCWIGGGCVILRGSHIGEGCVIGAGCVVTGDIPPHSIVTTDRNLSIRPIGPAAK